MMDIDYQKVIVDLVDNKLLIAVIAAFLAYILGLRSQRAILKEQHKLAIYGEIREQKDKLQAALMEQSAHLGSFSTECIMLRSIEQSKSVMKGVGQPEWQYDAQIRDRWLNYAQRASEGSTKAFEEFSKFFHTFEQTFFMYPHLKESFFLMRDENQKLFEKQQMDVVPYLFQVEPTTLLKEAGEKTVQDKLDKSKLVDGLVDLAVYLDDYFKLVQHALAGKIFKFEVEERKPKIGKVLTAEGWKKVKAKPRKTKAKPKRTTATKK